MHVIIKKIIIFAASTVARFYGNRAVDAAKTV